MIGIPDEDKTWYQFEVRSNYKKRSYEILSTDYNWDFEEEDSEKAIDHNLRVLSELRRIIDSKDFTIT